MVVSQQTSAPGKGSAETDRSRRVRAGIAVLGAVAMATAGAAFGAGTAAAADSAPPTLTVNAPTTLTTGAAPTAFTATATNPADGTDITNARFDFKFTGDPGLTADQIHLQYKQGDAFLNVPLSGATTDGGSITGSFGPATGFNFPAGADNTTTFQVSVDAGAPTGTLNDNVALDQVGGTQNPLAESTSTTSIIAGTADLQVGLGAPRFTQAGKPVTETVTVKNNGPQIAGGTQTTVFVPAGYTVEGDSASVTDAPFGLGKLVVFTSGALDPGATETHTVTATAPQGPAFGFTAAFSTSPTADPNIFNNVAFGFISSR